MEKYHFKTVDIMMIILLVIVLGIKDMFSKNPVGFWAEFHSAKSQNAILITILLSTLPINSL